MALWMQCRLIVWLFSVVATGASFLKQSRRIVASSGAGSIGSNDHVRVQHLTASANASEVFARGLQLTSSATASNDIARGLKLNSSAAASNDIARGLRVNGNANVSEAIARSLKSNSSANVSHASPSSRLVPSVFVAVFSTRGAFGKRNTLRRMWQEVGSGGRNICARFAICQDQDGRQPVLQKEQQQHGDLMLLPCAEGYKEGLLTRKLLATMHAYMERRTDPCYNKMLYMKTDDDTFVAGNKLLPHLQRAMLQGADDIYMGVPAPVEKPRRDPNDKWMEPRHIFPERKFPKSMYGGPGYIISGALVNYILASGLGENNVLFNEDRAVGVWLDKLKQSGVPLRYIMVPGTNGFIWDKPIRSGTWANYPYAFTHHLTPKGIECMYHLDQSNDPTALVDMCLASEPLDAR